MWGAVATGLRQAARSRSSAALSAGLHTARISEGLFVQRQAEAWSKWCDARAAGQACSSSLRTALRSPSTASTAAAAPWHQGTVRGYAALPQPNLSEVTQQAAQRLKAAAASVRAANEALAKTPGAIYRALPAPAKRLVDAAQTPGAVNRVLSLQLEAFWQRHSGKALALGGAALCYTLWKAMCSVAGLFVNVSDNTTSLGIFAFAASLVTAGGLFARWRIRLDPQHVYRLAMMRLNTHPGLLEVMGAPLAGCEVRACVLTGGRLKFSGLRPKLQSRRLQMIFPLKGSERRGLVSLEAKKHHGHYRFKLLAVDVPAHAGGEQRIFIEGGPTAYERGGVLGVLRDPFIRALQLENIFVAEDEADDAAEEAARVLKRKRLAAEAAKKKPQSLDAGGGMHVHERLALAIKRGWASLLQRPVPAPAVLPGAGGAAGKKP